MSQAKYLSVAVLSLLFVSGCTTENEERKAFSLPLTFTTSVHTPARIATDLTTENVTSVGLFASFTEGNYNASTATLNFMHNQKLEKSDGKWTYSPEKYWPVNANDKISFFAYAPHIDEIKTHGDDITDMSATTEIGYPAFTFVNSTAKTDLLIATPALNKNGGNVSLGFKHALTRVSFYIKNGDTTGGKKLQSFSVQSRKSGKYTFSETGFAYSAIGADMQEYAVADLPKDIPQNITDKVSIETFFIHPDAPPTFSMIYSINGNNADTVKIVSQKVPDTPVMASGANISYTITVNKDGYTIKASTEVEWTPGTASEFVCYEADELKMGDYYYSDGSTSDGGVRAMNTVTKEVVFADPLPGLAAGKTCIGLVFYVGAGPEDKAEYYVDRGLSEIKGYVIALKDVSNSIAWGAATWFGTSGSSSAFNGYSNTKTVLGNTTINSPAFNGAYNYASGTTPSAPATSSGWYYPSVAQLSFVCGVWDALNFPLVGGYYPTIGSYWKNSYSSSTENGATTMLRVYMGRLNGGIADYPKDKAMYVRSVLTF